MQILPTCVSLLRCRWAPAFWSWVLDSKMRVGEGICGTTTVPDLPLAMWIKYRLHCLLALNPLKGHEPSSKPKAMGSPPRKKMHQNTFGIQIQRSHRFSSHH